MLTLFLSLLGIVITIFFVVGVHEFGHFIVARAVGIKVLRFSIGFGKALYRWYDKKGTEYVIAAIPLGGYVKMLDETEAPVLEEESHLAYNRQSLYKRIAVIIAGPFFNLLFAFVLYWGLFVAGFISVVPLIGKIIPHSIAAKAGLKSQEEIVRIDNKPTASWTSVSIRLLSLAGNKGEMKIVTKHIKTQAIQTYTLDLTHFQMDKLQPEPLKSLGIIPYEPDNAKGIWPKNLLRKNQYNPVTALSHALQNTVDFTYLNFLLLGKMLTGKISFQSLGGPITIFETAGAALNAGIVSFSSFLAFLSISIGIINVLPIPGLDGGHLL
ncbi:MAG TPA: RIP metalloprotease RseP, partial [Gammaproteobacteria bacterium]|nr:RIP metalloprotease RseP [Gammaproteobacteria bacterium]